MTPLRLLHTEASCGWGGQELRILAEGEGMLARGHEVWIAAAPQSRLAAEARERKLPLVTLPIAKKSLAGWRSLASFLSKQRFDVVNTHSSTDAWLTALARLPMSDPPPMVRTRHISADIPRNAATRWLYRRATAHVVTTGEALRRDVIEHTGIDPQHVTSVPTGVDLARFRPGDRSVARARLGVAAGAFVVGIVATLRSWKGHLFLIEAIARCPDVDLLVVGDGPMRENLDARVDALQLRGRVRFAGHQADVVPWLHCLDVMALPSYANEGVPQALMQALACGIPIISTDVGGIAEIVRKGETGLRVAPRDAGAIAGAIARLRGDPALRERLAAAGAAQARERFSMDRMLDGMERVFESVLPRKSPARVQAAHSSGQ